MKIEKCKPNELNVTFLRRERFVTRLRKTLFVQRKEICDTLCVILSFTLSIFDFIRIFIECFYFIFCVLRALRTAHLCSSSCTTVKSRRGIRREANAIRGPACLPGVKLDLEVVVRSISGRVDRCASFEGDTSSSLSDRCSKT